MVGAAAAGQLCGASGRAMAPSRPESGSPRRPAFTGSGGKPRGLVGRDDLVIGIGNPLRSDDGVGWWLARRAERWLPASQLRAVQQLTPELAADVAAAARVLFIDAWLVPGGSGLEPTCKHHYQSHWAGRTAWRAGSPGLNDQPRDSREAIDQSRPGAVLHCLQSTPPPPAGVEPTEAELAGRGGDGAGVALLAAFSHQLSPRQLLSISELLFAGQPEAWQLLVPAFCLDHGEGFSPQLALRLPEAQRLLRQWMQARFATPTPKRA